MSGDAPRRIWLCADDYGISPAVNRGIRELIARGRLNATSVMMVGPAIGRDEIVALNEAVAKSPRCAIGLHATLTAPFQPLTLHFRPLEGGWFLPLGKKLRASLLRRLDTEMLRAELSAQIVAFKKAFGRAPDYLDGHQHVHIFPQVRDAFLSAVKEHAPDAWVRQCGRLLPLAQRIDAPKAMILDTLSATFRRRASRRGIVFNPGFSGAYDFTRQADFGALMSGFLAGMPEGGLIMCHPGFVDETLKSLDPLTDQREREYAFLASDDFPRLLEANKVTLV
jgi:chitin disaccharide deacetylase